MPKNPHADFTPALEGYSGQGKFRFWCQMALPLTYDDSLSYYELLCKVVNYLNHTIEDVANAETNVSRLAEAYTQLQNYVNNYFDDLDIEAELRNVLDAMAEDGTLDDLLDPLVQDHLPSVVDDQIDDVVADQIGDAVAGQIDDVVAEQLPPLVDEGIPGEVSDWLTENVDPVGSAVVVDSSLTISGAAADAKVTGDELADLKTQLNEDITVTHGANYLDISKSVDGYLNSNGTIHPNAQDTDWKTTNFIEVESGVTYNGSSINSVSGNFNTLGSFFWLNYNASKEIIGSQISNNPYPYTIPENVKYIRFSYHENGYINRMLAKSETRPTYEPYETIRLLNDSPYITREDKITYEQIEDCEIVGHGANYFDVSKSVDGYLNSNGTIHDNTSSTDWKTSDFIEVEEGITLYGSGVGSVSGNLLDLGCFFWLNFDTNKNIVGSQINTITFPYIIPNDVKYIRFSYHENGYIDRMLAESATRPTYEPYEVLYTFKHTNFLTTEEGAKKSDIVLNRYKNLKWAVFGDSLTEKNVRATTSYYDYIKEELGCTIINYGVSGTGYARGNSNFMTRMLNVNPNDFDILTIFGSFNDAGAGLDIGNPTDTTAETLCGCINITIDNFYSVAPYKVIGLVTPCPWASVKPASTWGNNYADAIIAIAKLRGIPYMDLFRESGIRPWAGQAYLEQYYNENGEQDNGVHPNSLGHRVFLYPHFRQFVKELF